MLSEEALERLSERVANKIEKANTKILIEIGKSIKKFGTLNFTQANQLKNMIIYGGNYQKIEYMLSQLTELNVKEIDQIFEEVAKNDLEFSKKFYDDFIPYEENIELQQEVNAIKNITINQYKNIADTRMIGFSFRFGDGYIFKPLKEAYIETIDQAILNISMGQETFDKSLKNTLKQLGKGLVTYESGRMIKLSSAVRMNINEGLTKLHNDTQLTIGKQFGADGVEISVHQNPAPDHELVQGKQFKIEEFNNFQNDIKATSFDGEIFEPEVNGHDRRSIGQYNCYHYIFSIKLGTKPEYSNKELKEINKRNKDGFTFENKHYTMYEGTQLQRRLEDKIVEAKDTQVLARESGDIELAKEKQYTINVLLDKYNDLCNASGLLPKKDRLSVSGYRKISV